MYIVHAIISHIAWFIGLWYNYNGPIKFLATAESEKCSSRLSWHVYRYTELGFTQVSNHGPPDRRQRTLHYVSMLHIMYHSTDTACQHGIGTTAHEAPIPIGPGPESCTFPYSLIRRQYIPYTVSITMTRDGTQYI